MKKHYEAIAKILGGSLYSSSRLKSVVKTFIEYFSSIDREFDIETFSKNALNGTYNLSDTEECIETSPVEQKANTWAPKPISAVSSRVDRINDDFEDAMKRMSTIVGKSYGNNQVKRGKNGKEK